MMAEWQNVRIGDFLFEREGKYPPEAKEVASLKRIEKIDFSGCFHIAAKPSKTNMIRIEPGDLVISGINVAKGALGVYEGNEAVAATIHYSSYSFDQNKINVEYFKRFLKSALFLRLLKDQVKGGIKTEIKPKHLLPLVIPLPDVPEQARILSRFLRIEDQDKQLKTELAHQKALLKKLRQQILQEAIEGRLTADWRAANPNAEPASELLNRIATEKAALLKAGKIKKQKPLAPISDQEKPFALPKGWVWCRLGEITTVNPGNSSPDDAKAGFTPMPLVSSDYCVHPKYEQRNWGDIKRGYTHFAENDVVIAKITPCFENSKSGVIKNYPNGLGAGTTELHVLRRITPDIEPEYMYFFAKTTVFIEAGRKLMKGAVGQKRVPREYIENAVLALPPHEEQKAIITKVEKLLALCDQLDTRITHNQTSAEALMQAVLHEAFRHEGMAGKG